MSDFSRRLKELRIANVKSQQELATALNVSQNAIYNWENGKREPSLEMLKKIAEYFKVSFDYLMGFEEYKPIKMYELFSGVYDSRTTLNKEKKMMYEFNQLNEEGKDKAIEQVEMLTQIPGYRLKEAADEVRKQPTSLPNTMDAIKNANLKEGKPIVLEEQNLSKIEEK